jgi:Flp pilus assembly protein TadG
LLSNGGRWRIDQAIFAREFLMRTMRFSSLHRLLHDRKGNMAMIFALMLVPVTFAIGMTVDYTSAARKRSQLNAAADAASLAAVTPAMMAASDASAQTAATNMFNAQIQKIPGLSFTAANLNVTITDNGLNRTVKVCYTAASTNNFSKIIGQSSFALQGCSTSASSVAPNIDFYLLLDSSPSMAIAATAAGISTMVSNTSSQGGCAFACHETNPSADNLGNPHGEDNYTLARNLGVTLRIDMLTLAAQNLTTTATTQEANNNAAYRMAIYTFDVAFNTIQALTSNLSTVRTQAGNIQQLVVYDNSCLTQSNCNNDTDTNSDLALSSINSIMPKPGGGTKTAGDSPQEVMFFVTDGVEDEMVSGNRVLSLMTTTMCTTIKNRGIRIAVLYLTYLPLPTNTFYNQNVAPFQPNIGTNLESCASPGLYTQVTTDSDISTALAQLFQQAVSTARLTN